MREKKRKQQSEQKPGLKNGGPGGTPGLQKGSVAGRSAPSPWETMASRLVGTALFRGMRAEEISAALSALQARERHFEKGSILLRAGQASDGLGFVLEGSVTIESCDIWGNRSILSHVGSGQIFAESYALLEDEPLLVDVSANENCRILFLKTGSIRQFEMYIGSGVREEPESWAAKLAMNLLVICARKNLVLSGRNLHTAPKTIRGRVMSYLTSASYRIQSKEFDIPFNRQQLADYLGVERSALSKELGKMQREGILLTKKNHFVLKKADHIAL